MMPLATLYISLLANQIYAVTFAKWKKIPSDPLKQSGYAYNYVIGIYRTSGLTDTVR